MSFLTGLRDGMRAFGERVGIIVNSTLLLVAYLVGIGLPAIAARISGKRFLEMRRRDSYWERLDIDQSVEGCYRQF